MARLVAVNRIGGLIAAGLMAGAFALLRAQAPMQAEAPPAAAKPSTPSPSPATNAAVAKPNSSATNTAAAKAPATNAAPLAPPLPPPIPDTYGRYGKILVPGDESTHPVKLHMPYPGFAEVKVPRQDELAMREKLEALWKLSDDDIRTQLAQWPAFSKMTLKDEGAMLQRIQDFRDYRMRTAQQKAHDMGLLTLTPDQKTKFEKDYWDKRLQMDRDLCKQFEPVFHAREQKMQDELFREFSSGIPGPAAPPAPAAPSPMPATNKPVATSSAPATNSVVSTGPAMSSTPPVGKAQ